MKFLYAKKGTNTYSILQYSLFLTMRILTLSILLVLTFSSAAWGQKTSEEDYATQQAKKTTERSKQSLRDRLVFGGNLGGNFGNSTYILINPMIGYRTTTWWMNGVSFNYTYLSTRGYTENMYGAGIWSRAYILKSIIAQSELEILKREARDQFGNNAAVTVPVWLVGAGYSSGGRVGLSAMIMYDLIQNPNSPYSNPIIRIGGLFGF
jgi:hypothetical protein